MKFSMGWFAFAILSTFIFQSIPRPLLADEITWLITDWRPYQYYEKGEYKGYGIEWQKIIQKELPEYQHKIKVVNFARMNTSFQEKMKVCALGLYKSAKRDSIVYYSIPDALWLSIRLFMRKETHQELGSPSKLSFKSIVKNKNRSLGLVKGRAYNSTLRKIIDEHQGQKNINTYSHSDTGKGMMAMLIAKRFDYHLEFLIEGKYAAMQVGDKDAVTSVALEELPLSINGVTACSKNEWGIKAIEAINRALLKVIPTEAYRRIFEKWLDPNLIPEYRKDYDAVFLKAK